MQMHPVISATPTIITLHKVDAYSLSPEADPYLFRKADPYLSCSLKQMLIIPRWILNFHAPLGECLFVMLR